MSEQTNQAMDAQEFATEGETNTNTLPDSLFADDNAMPETTAEAETNVNAVKETVQEEKPDDEAKPEQPPAQTLKIKYNGKEEEMSLEEAVALAQKGKNYDHVRAELDDLRTFRSNLENQAKQSGVSVDDYIKQLEENRVNAAREATIRELEYEYPEAPEEFIKEFAELRMEKKMREKAEAEQVKNREAEEARIKPWRDFMTAFPKVDVNSLPETVVQEIQGGKSPVEAYQAHLIAELQRENKVAEQHGKNKALAVGSARGDAAEKLKDDFLDGFWG